jgi:hypothetical protein
MTTLQEVDNRMIEILTKRGKREEGKQIQDFKGLLEAYKENFGLEISTEYLKGLLLEAGKNKVQAENTIKHFLCRNVIPTKEALISRSVREWIGYGEDSGYEKLDSNNKTLCFF